MEDLYVEIAQQLSDMGIDKENISWSTRLTLIALILLISYIITKLFRHLVIPAVHKITSRTKATWDDIVFDRKVMVHLSRMVAPVIIYLFVPLAFVEVGSSAMDFTPAYLPYLHYHYFPELRQLLPESRL